KSGQGDEAADSTNSTARRGNAVLVFVNPLYVVEQSFGTLHRKFRYARAAYFGLIKVSAQSHLKAMCLNLLKAANKLSAPAAA
ncbi:transposase, partial [Neisseria meningitidis]|uniref:transposase n=6 Tax=Neisseria meningitidis TaxID=487 RepID=UPI000A9BD7D8